MSNVRQSEKAGRNAQDLYMMLAEGKKVTTASGSCIRHREDWNDPNVGTYTSEKSKVTDILYFRANPQMNRIIGRLADGREEDVKISLLDISTNTFVEYIEPVKPKSWRDVFDAKKIFPADWRQSRNTATDTGYPYVCFNGIIYSIKDRYKAFPICTEEEL